MEERLERLKDSSYKPPMDLTQWILDRAKETGEHFDATSLCWWHVVISLGAVHTTGMQATQTLYDLAHHPECITPLREERKESFDLQNRPLTRDLVNAVLAEHNGVLLKSGITKLKKMDSFLKESQRVNPPGSGRSSSYINQQF